jgi:hypothetical protein
MRLLAIIASIGFFLACTPYRNFSYETSMTPSTQSDSLIYEDDSIKVKFTLADDRLKLRLDNKLNQGIRINWDEVSISLNGQSFRVAHKETGVFKTSDVQPVTSIPPKSFLTDGLIPTDKISYNRLISTGTSTVILAKMFPSADNGKKNIRAKALALKGSTVIVYMPLYINNQFVSKCFSITIHDVNETVIPLPSLPG